MGTLKKFFVAAIASVAAVLSDAKTVDLRPAFDKSDYLGHVGIHVNPWFPLDKHPMHALGGPNTPWKRYEGEYIWAQGMRDLYEYGVDVWSLETDTPGFISDVTRMLYDGVAALKLPVKIGSFVCPGDFESNIDKFVAGQLFFKIDLRNDPRTLRAGGNPVILIYWNPVLYEPKKWAEIFSRIDAKMGRNVYLMDASQLAYTAQLKEYCGDPADRAKVDAAYERLLRKYLPCFDGVSSYANGYRMPYQVMKRVMKEWPQKIHEGQMHQCYTCHFQFGGTGVDLTKNWRDAIDECLASDPDTIFLTNLFDHYENSILLPTFEREDFELRYFECRTANWRKREFRRLDYPELIVTSCQSVRLGRDPLEFEVIGLPISNRNDTVTIHLDLCDTSGKVLKTFDRRSFKLDRICVEHFAVPSIDFAQCRGVVPRLRYDWAGGSFSMNFGPMTLIDPSMRPYLMYWARSTKNELKVNGTNHWTMDGIVEGGTHRPRKSGLSQISCDIKAVWQGDPRKIGMGFRRLRRDYSEIAARKEESAQLSMTIALPTPRPGKALHWYTLEGVNRNSCSYQTLPIWETEADENEKVWIPEWLADGSIRNVEVEKCRVPVWDYDCAEDFGRLYADVSGWCHMGKVKGSGFVGGHLGYTGYNHYHNGFVEFVNDDAALYRKEANGKGYYSFNGSNDYVNIQGGTAFPGAFTYELDVRPKSFGREMGLVGTGNNQIHINILADGRVCASRGTPVEGRAGKQNLVKLLQRCESETKLGVGEWSHIAVVYDLHELTLYINGGKSASVMSAPDDGHEWINHVILGAKCAWPCNPVDFFEGDIGHVRISGRNLDKDEFLETGKP